MEADAKQPGVLNIPGVTVDPEFLTAPQKSLILSSLHVILNGLEKTLKEKNADYSGGEGEFANFLLSSHLSGVPVQKGILVRMCDKVSRIRTLLSHPPLVKEESFEDTITDLIGYTVILHAYRQSLSLGHLAPKDDR